MQLQYLNCDHGTSKEFIYNYRHFVAIKLSKLYGNAVSNQIIFKIKLDDNMITMFCYDCIFIIYYF